MSVNDDVMESDGHADSMRGTLDRIPGTRCSAGDEPSPQVMHAVAPSSCDQPDAAAAREPVPANEYHQHAGPGLRPGRGPRSGTQRDADLGDLLLGGGIRSASYCLGALQGLEKAGLLGKARLILGVSGGSYIAASRALVAHGLQQSAPGPGADPARLSAYAPPALQNH